MSTSFSLHGTVGALFIGTTVANTLYGISLVQAFYYYRHQNDKWTIKYLVTAVMICDTIHQAMITHTVYTYAITNWGNAEELGRIVPTLSMENLPNCFTAFFVQSFLTLRVWRLSSGNIALTMLLAVFVLAELFAVVVFTGLELQFDTFAQLLTLKPLSLSINILAAVGDALIAGALCFLLHRFRTGFQRSDTMINKLILFAVNTGVLTSLCATASFISYMSSSHTFIYVAFYFNTGRLYTNCLLATLNARKLIGGCTDNIHNTATDKVTVSLRDLSKSGTSSRRGGNISIQINTTKECVSDFTQGSEAQEVKIEHLQTSASNALVSFEDKNDGVYPN